MLITIEKAPGVYRVTKTDPKGEVLEVKWEPTRFRADQTASVQRGKTKAEIVDKVWDG